MSELTDMDLLFCRRDPKWCHDFTEVFSDSICCTFVRYSLTSRRGRLELQLLLMSRMN